MMQEMLLSLGASQVGTKPPIATDQHGSHLAQASLDPQEIVASIVHGATLCAVVLLAGLVAFMVLVWLPTAQLEDAAQEKAAREKAVGLFCRWMWVLVGLLIVAGLTELPLYAVRASGEALSPGLLNQALFDTKVGQIWVERIVFGIVTAAVTTYAANRWSSMYTTNLRRSAYSFILRRSSYWLGAALIASALLLMTLTRQSHAAAEESFLPFIADWLHVMAASFWLGGLLGFPILLVGARRGMPPETRAKLLSCTVQRFSKVATIAVMTLIAPGCTQPCSTYGTYRRWSVRPMAGL